MKKEGKRVIRWRTATTKLEGAAYLQEMAEKGWILEDMNHLTYAFREGEPQYLCYRMEQRERTLSEEERVEYEKNGWREVCHYELEYIFVRGRDPFADDVEEHKEIIMQDLEQKIKREEKTEKNNRYIQLGILGCLFLSVFLISGFSKETLYLIPEVLLRWAPWILLAYLASRRRVKKLRQEQERVQEGDISDEYTDWRKSRKTTFCLIAGLLVCLFIWVFYTSDFNERTFVLPTEISYKEIPAVRLERLTEEPLRRTGESIDPSMEGFRFNLNFGEGTGYDIQKEMGGFENYVVDYRYQWETKRQMETQQCMQTEDDIELKLDTMFYQYRDSNHAGREYRLILQHEKEMEEYWKEEGFDFPAAEVISEGQGEFETLHLCRTEWGKETSYHLVYRLGVYLLELDYAGKDIPPEKLIAEVEKVIEAQ